MTTKPEIVEHRKELRARLSDASSLSGQLGPHLIHLMKIKAHIEAAQRHIDALVEDARNG